MNHALYAPKTGYYTREKIHIGEQGDFTTAPESSYLFSQAVAKQINQVLQVLNEPVVLECGAGTGRFAIECLKELERDGHLPDQYLILERSSALATLQKQQFQEHIPHLQDRIQHINALPEKPFKGVVFANEVLDALVFDCFIKQDGQILERAVQCERAQYQWVIQAPSQDLLSAVAQIESEIGPLPDGYCSEVCLQVAPWIRALSDCLSKGLLLFIDYGYGRSEYYRPDRHSGTLMCYHQHKGHDNPFINVGEQDITAHVDFTRVAEAGVELGLDLLGYTNQMQFLATCGIEQLADRVVDPIEKRNQLMRILHPAGMGESFKVMGLGRRIEIDLIGFEGMSLVRHL